ncbi:MAG: hypothetical protein U0V70_04065 [Terriglobia bacterium]
MNLSKSYLVGSRSLVYCLALGLSLLTCNLSFLALENTNSKTQPPKTSPQDPGWPREIKKDGARLIMYQPQIGEWKEYRSLTADIAFSLTPAGGQPTLGVATLAAKTVADVDRRIVVIQDIQVTNTRFPSLAGEEEKKMDQLLRELLPTTSVTISLDRLIAGIQRSRGGEKPVAVNMDPPIIFVSEGPAILLLVDGEPARAPIEKTELEFIVNTNWDLFYDKPSKHYFLVDQAIWMSAAALEGPWEVTGKLPADFSKLPATDNWADVRKTIPPTVSPSIRGPKVFYSSKPAELILFNGKPAYAPIAGTQLAYASNTESDIFVDHQDGAIYFLTSGRWFRAKSLQGPWTYAGDNLPSDFAKIPPDGARSHVLASVPGTQEAQDAVLLAQLPTTAVINRAEAEAMVKVTYDGNPEFKPIENTTLQYAVNTPEKVIRDGDLYYLCFQGAWFTSKTPQGPWKAADSVPKEIYTIPPSSPVYNVTYVTISDPTPTTVVYSYTAGYTGMYVVGTSVGLTVAYGTGYYYPPYYYWGPYPYPIYRPYPYTYGVHAVYNPYTGGYHVGHAVYGPYGAAGGSAWYNPATGRYGRSATVQTPYGGRTVAGAYNPWTGGYGATRQGHNAYAQWGSSAVVRGDDWARTGHVTTSRGTVAGINSSQGSGVIARGSGGGFVAGGSGNNVYAGKDGNIYKKDSSGSWQKYNNGSWNTVDTSAARQQAQQKAQNSGVTRDSLSQNAQSRTSQTSSRPSSVSSDTMSGLNREASARQRGEQQVNRQQQWNRSSSMSRPSGGYSRAGGGRRR